MTEERRTVRDIGEFGLIGRIANIVGKSPDGIGIGDDTAVLPVPYGELLLATVDMLVENVHFRRQASAQLVGKRAIGVNISDIAAMGGTPRHALVSIALPADLHVSYVEELYRGMTGMAGAYGVTIAGGNITGTSGPICIDVTLLGNVHDHDLLLRSGAIPGDALAVTGTLGGAAATRLWIESGRSELAYDLQRHIEHFAVPHPRVAIGQRLGAAHLAHAVMDLSDGLGSDIQRICAESGVGAVIVEGRLPIAASTRRLAGFLGLSAVDLALAGGEDYELLVALPVGEVPRAAALAHPVPWTVVGEVLPADKGLWLEKPDGTTASLEDRGWRHF